MKLISIGPCYADLHSRFINVSSCECLLPAAKYLGLAQQYCRDKPSAGMVYFLLHITPLTHFSPHGLKHPNLELEYMQGCIEESIWD